MSTFQERILAASGSSSGTADTDPELYRYRSASSEEYLESCNYRVWSTELSDRFLVWWMCPVGRDEAEQRSLERELRSDEESPLHIPLEIFMTAYYERYERVKGMASFLSDDCAVGSEDAAAAVEAQLAGDADYRAQAFAFIEGFVCFQQSFSRHGIARASAALLIWLNENVPLYASLNSAADGNLRGNSRNSGVLCFLRAAWFGSSLSKWRDCFFSGFYSHFIEKAAPLPIKHEKYRFLIQKNSEMRK